MTWIMAILFFPVTLMIHAILFVYHLVVYLYKDEELQSPSTPRNWLQWQAPEPHEHLPMAAADTEQVSLEVM